MSIHVVKGGDSLWSISSLYRIPVADILQVNGLLSPDLLMPGLALYIPDRSLSLRYYQISAGDTLWKIANMNHTSIASIISANPGINPNLLSIGQRLNIPSPNKLRLTSLGFIVPQSLEESMAVLESLANQLTYVAVVAFSLTEEGYAYVLLKDLELVARSHQLNVTPLLMIRNFFNGGFSPELIGNVLGNPVYRNNLVRSLVNLARSRGYSGVSIDFEFIPPQRRNEFTLFLTDLKRELNDLILHVNIHAKSEDMPTNRIVGAYDYRAIGNAADIVAVMTIDYGYPTGPPDPIAPIGWVEEVIRYAVTQMNPRKVQIAIALYGYDKIVNSTITTALSVQAAQQQALSLGTVIEYDDIAQAPWYRYYRMNEEHIVWFEDIRSFTEKYKLIDLYQLLGSTFWHIGLPAPQNWAYMRDHLQVRKLNPVQP
ncbi:LysM peptidoglycan-binding domain-containing protein [Bacillus benzoevorans]|uniref:Spore germination protein n=1 Tax=Bacillus benzoevorans TaxID=1456 RepID=A0A7X0HVN5_9BACI|nr:spore germination protein [Bacillus benzoevorans]